MKTTKHTQECKATSPRTDAAPVVAAVVELSPTATAARVQPQRFQSTLGRLALIDALGRPVVCWPNSDGTDGQARWAHSTVEVSRGMIGAAVVVAFLDGDPERPVMTGVLQTPHPSLAAAVPAPRKPDKREFDANELVFSARSQITLRCGKSSIVLTKTGRVELRGDNLLSRASSSNRIRGGVIQLN